MHHPTFVHVRAQARRPLILSLALGLGVATAGCADAEAGAFASLDGGGDGLASAAADEFETGSETAWEDEGGDEGDAPLLDLPAGDSGDDSPCESELFSWEPIRPQLIFVLDHSGSMSAQIDSPLGGSWSRWEALHEVVRLTLERREDEVEFGLKVFPTPLFAESDSCAVFPGVEFAPAPNAMLDMLSVMPPADSTPQGATPIYAGLEAAGEALLAADPTRPRALLLVADGGISASCGELENSTDAGAYLTFLRQVEGIDSYVVGVGDEAAQSDSLEVLAIAGGQAGVFQSADGAELDAAIGNIVDSLRSCEVQLESPYPPGDEVALLIGDVMLEAVEDCAQGEGYIYDTDTGRMLLCEQACSDYFEGVEVEVEHFCQPG